MSYTADAHPTSAHVSGRLMAMGTLFVAGTLYTQRTSIGKLQYVLPMVQRDGQGVMGVTGIWSGPAADSFVHMHRAHIKPGKALDVTFTRLFVHSNELHGILSTAVLAPDRWPARVDNHAAGGAAPGNSSTTTTKTTNTKEGSTA